MSMIWRVSGGNYPGKWLICNGIEPIDLTNEGHEPQSPSDFGKRRASDHAKTPPPKRMKERTRPFAGRLGKTQTKDLEEIDETDFTRPHDKGFPTILEATHHANRTLLDLTPKSATELAALQQDWQSHGHGSTLAEGLFVAQSHVLSMKGYLENALELLSLLEDCDGWKVVDGKLEVVPELRDTTAELDQLQAEESVVSAVSMFMGLEKSSD